jgi:hypothetical protein
MTGFGRLGLPVRFFAITPGRNGGMTAAGAGAITGIGLTSGAGFLVRETVGGGFLGMEPKMRLLGQNGKLGAIAGAEN